MFEGMCCQSPPPISGAWEGKHRVDLKRHLKGAISCQKPLAPVLLSLPPFLSPPLSLCCCSSQSCPSPSTLYAFILSAQCETFFLTQNGKQPHRRSSLLFWLVPGVKTPGIISVTPVQKVQGSHARALESSFTHKTHACAHTHTHTHTQAF